MNMFKLRRTLLQHSKIQQSLAYNMIFVGRKIMLVENHIMHVLKIMLFLVIKGRCACQKNHAMENHVRREIAIPTRKCHFCSIQHCIIF